MINLEKYGEELRKNIFLVKICRSSCPIAQVTGVETYTNHAILQIIYYLHTGQLEWTVENVEPIYMCNLCARCNHFCETTHFKEIIEIARAMAYQKGVAPKKILKAKETILKGLTEIERNLEQIEKRENGNETLILGGHDYNKKPQMILEAINIFEKIGEKFDYLGKDEPYCGENLFDLGIVDEALNFAKKAVEKLNHYKKVIVIDPATYNTIKNRYPQYNLEIKPEIIHYTQELVKYGEKIKPKKEVIGKTAYTDPCELAQTGITEEPRKIIKNLDIETVELLRKEKEVYPTGTCGSFELIDKEIANKVTIEKMAEILDLKIENLITTSIREKENIEQLAEKAGIKLDIYDLLEIIKIE